MFQIIPWKVGLAKLEKLSLTAQIVQNFRCVHIGNLAEDPSVSFSVLFFTIFIYFQAVREIYDEVEEFKKRDPADIVDEKYKRLPDEIYQRMPLLKNMKKNAQRHRHSEPELKNLPKTRRIGVIRLLRVVFFHLKLELHATNNNILILI